MHTFMRLVAHMVFSGHFYRGTNDEYNSDDGGTNAFNLQPWWALLPTGFEQHLRAIELNRLPSTRYNQRHVRDLLALMQHFPDVHAQTIAQRLARIEAIALGRV